jgi:uncharacterized protein
MDQNLAVSSKTETISARIVFAGLLLLVVVGALVTYKTAGSLAVLEKVQSTGVFQPRFELIQSDQSSVLVSVLNRTFDYFSVVWIALLFGILISGAMRIFVSPAWLSKLFRGGSLRSQLTAGLAGAPLMLCSCCVAPIFTSVYGRSSRLAPSLALMLAAPALNPAALILTFMLFGGEIGITRLLASAVAVFVTGIIAEKFIRISPASCSIDQVEAASAKRGSVLLDFAVSSGKVALQTLPLIIIGVAISMLVAQWLPIETSILPSGIVIVLVSLISVLLAMPTFFEIPLALMMLAAGLPEGAAVAVLIAGPITNLPSLFTIGRSTGWKVPLTVAAIIWLIALGAGLSVNLF